MFWEKGMPEICQCPAVLVCTVRIRDYDYGSVRASSIRQPGTHQRATDTYTSTLLIVRAYTITSQLLPVLLAQSTSFQVREPHICISSAAPSSSTVVPSHSVRAAGRHETAAHMSSLSKPFFVRLDSVREAARQCEENKVPALAAVDAPPGPMGRAVELNGPASHS